MAWRSARSLSLPLTTCLIESVCDTPDMPTGEGKTHLRLMTCLIEEARTYTPAKLFADCIYLL